MTGQSAGSVFLESAISRLKGLKHNAEGAMAQLDDRELHWTPDAECNSVAVNVQHIHGNMISRWTDFLTTDGDKPTRDRDAEFTANASLTREEITKLWEEGWTCLLSALDSLGPEDVVKNVTIRGEQLTVIDAVLRQLSHYAYHVGQIVLLAKQKKSSSWKTLSVARGESKSYKPIPRDHLGGKAE